MQKRIRPYLSNGQLRKLMIFQLKVDRSIIMNPIKELQVQWIKPHFWKA